MYLIVHILFSAEHPLLFLNSFARMSSLELQKVIPRKYEEWRLLVKVQEKKPGFWFDCEISKSIGMNFQLQLVVGHPTCSKLKEQMQTSYALGQMASEGIKHELH